MKNSPEEIFNKEDYVFFKMKGYPWWPGYITDIEKSNKRNIYTIADPFTNTLSKINDIKNIIKFEENIEDIASKAKGKKYINSIIVSIETYFEGRKIPERFNKIMGIKILIMKTRIILKILKIKMILMIIISKIKKKKMIKMKIKMNIY